MFNGAGSRKTVLISLALVVAIALSMVLAASSGQQAAAYPLDWTVQTSPGPASGATEVSVATRYNCAWLAWRGSPGLPSAISVSRSTDYGATWETPIVIEDGSFDTGGGAPKLVVGRGGPSTYDPIVWLFYVSTRDTGLDGGGEIWIAKSDDLGVTWPTDPAYRWHSGSTVNEGKPDAYFTGAFVHWVYSTAGGSWYEIKYGGAISNAAIINPVGTLISNGLSHSVRPSLASHDHDVVVVWEDFAHSGYNKKRICSSFLVNHYTGTFTAPEYVAYSENYDHAAPVVTWDGGTPLLISQLKHTDGSHYVASYYHDGTEWRGIDGSRPPVVVDSIVANTGAVANYPSVRGSEGWEYRFYQDNSGQLELHNNYSRPAVVTNDFLGATNILQRFGAVDCRGGSRGMKPVAAVSDDGRVYFRTRDGTAPDVNLTDPGSQAGSTTYLGHDFSITSTAIDNFPATGTDIATGLEIHNGIRRVSYEYSTDGDTWSTVECAGGDNYAYAPPYSLTALSAPLDGKKFKIRACAEDSTGSRTEEGNVGYGESAGWIVVDTQAPGTTLTAEGTAGDNGFLVSHPTVTITSSDPYTDRIEYRLINNFNGSSAGNWTTYDKAFTLEDGIWEIEHKAIDKAGNAGAVTTSMVKVDTIGPACAISRPDRDFIEIGFEDGMEYRLTGSATDSNGVARSAILINGEEVYSTKTEHDMAFVWQLPTIKDAGNYEIAVAAKDMAGNLGSTSKNVVLDNFCKDWFFAEGNTLAGFDEFICLANPGDNDADVVIGFHLETGDVIVKNFSLPAHSRQTVVVKDHVPEGNHVSAHVHCDNQAIVAERPMYFDYRGKWTGGHNEKGVNAPQKNWYFAEGTTRKNSSDGEFEEWICLQNPGEETATVKITYMTEAGDNIIKHYQVGPHSRKTVDVAADVGLDQDVSTAIESDIGICAERPQYSNYHQFAPGGHVVSGVASPLTEWYFAEGSTRQGFQEWVTIQNPNTVPAKVKMRYMTSGEGSETGSVIESEREVAPRSRETVKVADDVGDNRDVSIELASDVPVVAERPMYFSYGGGAWTGGHDVMGVSRAATEYYFAEGTTRDGYDTWFTIQNPGDHSTNVQIDLMYPDGKVQTKTLYVNPHTRVTLSVDDMVDGPCDVAATIKAGSPIVVERPMYFDYHGWTGGHNTSGYGTD